MAKKFNETERALLTIRSVLQLFLIVTIFFVLSYLSGILQPFVLAGLCALIFQPLVYKLGQKKVPSFLSLPIVCQYTNNLSLRLQLLKLFTFFITIFIDTMT